MQLRDTRMAQTTIASERHMSKTSVSEVFQIAKGRKLHYAAYAAQKVQLDRR